MGRININMKKIITAFIIVSLFSFTASAQTYLTRNGRISFFSKTPMEDIDANNNEVTSILDIKKGEFAFVALVKSFKFQKALMEEHFNENYMESNTFPKASFKGAITDLSKVNFLKDGNYPVTVKGDLTIHGVTRNVAAPGIITVSQGKINAKSNFNIKLKDYNIKVPVAVVNKIAESIAISVDCKYEPFKKG